MKGIAIAIVVVALCAGAFGAHLWLPASEAKEWDQLAGFGLIGFAIWCVFSDGER